jgi:hypothetical protein
VDNFDGIVSLFLACTEIVLFVNLLIFADKNKENILVFLLIFLLACYQVFEYLICGIGIKSSRMAYYAFADISFLPPFSFLLVSSFRGIKLTTRMMVLIPAIFFVIYYSSVINRFAVTKCTVLYASYNYPLGTLYGVFYYLPLFISVLTLNVNLRNIDETRRKQTKLLLAGHYFIIIPLAASFILFLLNLPGLLNSIESILCKFAFGYAVVLGFFALNNRTKNE